MPPPRDDNPHFEVQSLIHPLMSTGSLQTPKPTHLYVDLVHLKQLALRARLDLTAIYSEHAQIARVHIAAS